MSRRSKKGGASAPRVVLDTGLLLHALLLGDDKARRLRQAWQGGACRPLIAAATAQLLMRALACPALKLNAAQQQELLADFLPYAEVVADPAPRSRGQASASLQLAVSTAARAEQLVSDCGRTRGAFSRLGAVPCGLLCSEEFLTSL
ncbi:PIN domain-containing protein [Roseateles violae]|uniref:PIN domain-containing protein n=1 Tax=Roseateles violae TaxID=3058042 RepID=A0ABT8DLB9_9BURK|nr:PIN domain-containing protein [Pelomonas sp. PFR6]MDN3919209.1 PIN domain-containing protein [Pelomonas sp. PFR6]